MVARKTRCKQCISKNKKATEAPCDECAEIRFLTKYKLENHFLDEDKNLMRENIDEENEEEKFPT